MSKSSLAFGICFLLISSGFIPITLGFNVKISRIEQPFDIGNGNTLYVGGSGPNNYTKIQDAIDDALDGDTVFVYSGTYYENLIINKSVNLVGEDKDTTIINGDNFGIVIIINADDVTISSFTIQNSGDNYREDAGIKIHSQYNTIISNNIKFHIYGILIRNTSQNNLIRDNKILENYRGIFINYSNFNIVIDNTISNNDQDGIILRNSSNNIISYNVLLQNNWEGIFLDDFSNSNWIIGNNIGSSSYYSTGIMLQKSIDNKIIGNNPFNNYAGIILIYYSINNIISGNNISKNRFTGIRLSDSRNNTITNNNISSNNLSIMLHRDSYNNIIYHNNFINNKQNAYDDSNNNWDDGRYGNYWSDYNIKYPDAKKRLLRPWLWNTPYEIDGGDNKDMCPLVNQWPNPRPRTITRDTPTNSPKWLSFFDMFPILQRILNFIK